MIRQSLKNMSEEEKKAHKREIHRLHQRKYYEKNKDYYRNYQRNWAKQFNEEIIKLKSQNKLLSAENSYYKNIINEMKNMCKEEYYKKNTNDIDSIGLSNNIWVMIYMKLKELKENNK